MESQVGSSSYDESQVGSPSYDVFINFRGEDTRNIFVGHLHRALEDRGFHTFIDSKYIWKGDDIGPVLFQSIKGSKLSIAIFSKRYTESKWCLRELAQMLECHENNDQIIIPIFFNVTPSDVKNQTGSFKISRKKLGKETPETLQRWKDVLREVGLKSGWVYNDGDDASKLVDNIVQDAWNRLDVVPLTNAENPVGLKSRVDHVLSLLSTTNSKNVQFIGIYGMGGIGKTTIATDIYNHIYKSFKKFCFLEDIREQASQPDGIASLQEKLLKRIFSEGKVISSPREGSSLMKERLGKIDALLILDDVLDRAQLHRLAGDYLNFLGPKSRIIITSRDRNVLDGIPEENRKIYEPEELNKTESLRLFCLHAFSMDQPPDDYKQLSVDIVDTTGGLPLALEVLGSELSSQKDKEIWKSMHQRLKQIPHHDIYGKLKISYDNLQDDTDIKAMFLDVACFFIGWKEETVISIWKACGFDAIYCLQVLKRKSLLKITRDKGLLWMHDQTRDMGRRIAYRQRPSELDKYCRLWSRDNIVRVVNGCMANKKVEGIFYDCNCIPYDTTCLHTKGFEKMPRLRLLRVDGATLKGSFQCLPLALRWLRWSRCPLEEIPADFYHEELVILDLRHGKFRQAWNKWPENKKFQQLKVLKLSNCQFLSESPDFSGFPCLETLDLGYCSKLVYLHESIRQLKQLLYLNLEYCISLKKVPNSIRGLTHLKTLILTCCESLEELPGSIGDLKESLVEFVLDFTKIKALPEGAGLLKKLEAWDLSRCRELVDLPSSMENMTSLHFIDLSGRENLYIPKLALTLTRLVLRCRSSAEQFRGFIRINQSKYKKVDQPYVITNHLGQTDGQLTDKCSREIWIPLQETYEGPSGSGQLQGWKNIWIHLQETDEGPSRSSQLQGWRDIWIHLQERDEGSSRSGQLPSAETSNKKMKTVRYLIPCDGICRRLIMQVALGVDESKRTQWEDENLYICLNVEAYIHRKDKKTKCETKLVIDGIKLRCRPDHIVYFHEFKGFDWFGFQLEGEDAIEISNVPSVDFSYEYQPYDSCSIECVVTQLQLFLIKEVL